MPKNAKIAPPATANTASVAAAAIDARIADRFLPPGSVIETKIGAQEIGLMIEKREENARMAKSRSSVDKNFIFSTLLVGAQFPPQRTPGRDKTRACPTH